LRFAITKDRSFGVTVFVPERLDSRPNEMEFSGERSESAATTG